MITYSIIILLSWFACILGPIFLAMNIPTEESEPHTEHHFLKG